MPAVPVVAAAAFGAGRARRQADERSTRATKSDTRALRRQAASGDKLLDDVYRQGERAGRAAAKSRRRPPARRRRSGVTSTAIRQLQAPVKAQAVSGIRTIGLTLALVALYVFLTNAEHFAGFIGGLGKGLNWLADPSRPVPYATR